MRYFLHIIHTLYTFSDILPTKYCILRFETRNSSKSVNATAHGTKYYANHALLSSAVS